VPAAGGDATSLTATWARAHLRDLEDRYATDPTPDRELERRIVETSLRFGVLCRFTAFVAADVQVVNEGGVVHRVLQPVEAPAGWTMFERVGLAAAAMPMARMSAGGLQSAGPVPGRFATPRGPAAPGGLLGKTERRLGALRGRVGPGGPARRRSGGFTVDKIGTFERLAVPVDAYGIGTSLTGRMTIESPGPSVRNAVARKTAVARTASAARGQRVKGPRGRRGWSAAIDPP
jgi:hypothetical protein